MSDEERRAAVYDGQLFVFSAMPSVRRFVDFARQMIEAAFAPLDPETAQHACGGPLGSAFRAPQDHRCPNPSLELTASSSAFSV